ncbi:MAG: YkgJ family cysteine cluster protein [Candidatus Ornithospirochaeta sp.]
MESLDTLEKKANKEWNANSKKISWLKYNVDEDLVDKAFHKLHERLFSEYDCSSCRNCCKKRGAVFTHPEIKAASEELGMTEEEFIGKYIGEKGKVEYVAKGLPCPLLGEDGCILSSSSRPVGCKDYPYTNKGDMAYRLHSILLESNVCPVVLEMLGRIIGEVEMIEIEEGRCDDSMDF